MDTQSQPAAPSATTDTGSVNGADLAQVIAQAVSAGVTSSLNEITAKLNQISDSVKSVNDDRGFSSEVTGAHDIYENMRRTDVARDRIQVYAEQALANAVELAKGVGMRSLDHFGSLPPVAPKASGC